MLALALVEVTLLDGVEYQRAVRVARLEAVDHRHGGQTGADHGGEGQASGLWPQQLVECLLGLLEARQCRGFRVAAAEHGEQAVEGLMKLGQLLAKTAASTQGDELCKRDLVQVSGHLQRDLQMEAILAAPVVVARFEQVEQPVQIVVIRNEGPLIGECPLTGEPHGEKVGKASRHPDPALVPAGKAVVEAKTVQALQAGLGRAKAVVVGALTPACDEFLVAKYLVADKIGGEKAAELTLQLGSYGGKEGGLRPLCQQIRLCFEGLQQGGQAALFADGEDEGEPLQIEQGKLEPELVTYLHAGVVDIGLHRINLLSGSCQGAGSGIYAKSLPCGKHCVVVCEQKLIQ